MDGKTLPQWSQGCQDPQQRFGRGGFDDNSAAFLSHDRLFASKLNSRGPKVETVKYSSAMASVLFGFATVGLAFLALVFIVGIVVALIMVVSKRD